MGTSNSSGVGTHTNGDGELVTFDENGLEIRLGQDEVIEPDEVIEATDKTPPEPESQDQEPESEDQEPAESGSAEQPDSTSPDQSGQSEQEPAAGGFLVPEAQSGSDAARSIIASRRAG